MRRFLPVLVFISVFLWRWTSLDSPLPSSWTPDSVVRFTAPILEQPEQTDTKTIVRSGIWYIPLRGYAGIIPGSRIIFTGKVTPQVQLKKITRIRMVDPTFEVVSPQADRRLRLIEKIIVILGMWREKWVYLLEMWLPEPMASLAAGILLGGRTQMPADFYQALVNTGTLHIIAASGYNVSIVLSVIMRIALSFVSRGRAIMLGIVGVLVYVVIAGMGASVVRAGVMGSLTLVAFYFGRPTEARRILWISAALMLLMQPLLIFDIGFQLSFAATAGLLYLEPWIRSRFQLLGPRLQFIQSYFAEYLYPTLAASISTLPIILWHFGRVSLVSPLVNMLVLPLIPLIMGLTAAVIGVGMLLPVLGQLLAWLLYPMLWWMVTVIRLLG